jgi:hypothetical protein
LAPIQLIIIFSALVILPLAWFRGGTPERAVAVLVALVYASTPLAQMLRWDRLYVGAALIDVVVLCILGWFCLRYDRWWLLVATAAQTLSVMATVVLILTPSLTARENVAAQWAFTLVSLASILLGVAERRLAGETPGGSQVAKAT